MDRVPSSSSPTSWIAAYYPAFDGLRAVAILMVFLQHYLPLVFQPRWGELPLWSGVDLFFVLSGFLITGILVDSRKDPTFFRNFYGRRALRIWPLWYLLWALVLVLTQMLGLRYSAYIWTTAVFFGNWFLEHGTMQWHGNPCRIYFGHAGQFVQFSSFWTLCVEEQYYLVWPFLLYFIRSPRWLMRICVTGVLFTVVLRCLLYRYTPDALLETRVLYWSTYTRCDSILIGSFVALWLRHTELTRQALHRIGTVLISGSLSLLLIGFAWSGSRWQLNEIHPVFCTYGYTLVALIAAGILLFSLDSQTTLFRWMCHPWLSGLGKISFGFYVLHFLPVVFVSAWTERYFAPHHLSVLMLPLCFFSVYATAWLSYRYVERPFLRLKWMFQPKQTEEARERTPVKLVG